MAIHIFATKLHSTQAPLSLKHYQFLNPKDKQIWDAAYKEEYDDLVSLGCFDIITEK